MTNINDMMNKINACMIELAAMTQTMKETAISAHEAANDVVAHGELMTAAEHNSYIDNSEMFRIYAAYDDACDTANKKHNEFVDVQHRARRLMSDIKDIMIEMDDFATYGD